MALIKCPKCGKEFSDRALVCPQCGYKTDNSKKNKRFVIYSIILLVITLLIIILNPSGALQFYLLEPYLDYDGEAAWVRYGGYVYNVILACYFTVFWIRQAKSMKNTSLSIYAYTIAVLSLFIVGWKFGLLPPFYVYYFALLGIAIMLYGIKLKSHNKNFAIISGSLWLCASLFFMVMRLMYMKGSLRGIYLLEFVSYGQNILPSVSIISTILFIISCYLPDLKKKTLQN